MGFVERQTRTDEIAHDREQPQFSLKFRQFNYVEPKDFDTETVKKVDINRDSIKSNQTIDKDENR